jgi:hypothetical protein
MDDEWMDEMDEMGGKGWRRLEAKKVVKSGFGFKGPSSADTQSNTRTHAHTSTQANKHTT